MVHMSLFFSYHLYMPFSFESFLSLYFVLMETVCLFSFISHMSLYVVFSHLFFTTWSSFRK